MNVKPTRCYPMTLAAISLLCLGLMTPTWAQSQSDSLKMGELELLDGSSSSDTSASKLPPLQYHNGIPYITGGIGSDEASAFKEQRKDFPLSLNFGQQVGARTAFAADVQIVIRDQDDNSLFNINSEGPYCLIDLEPGQYTLYATYMGDTKSRNIDLSQGEAVAIDVIWPADLSDGSVQDLAEDLKQEFF